tara:strand:+ start:2146 stop:3000 length:855 start_codon:yes stop_codon:yes gene_type:complete
MIKKISYILYCIINFFNSLIIILINKNILLWFYTFIQEDSYRNLNLLGKKVKFFCPNHLINFRIDTFFSKEPETINWINNFKNKNKEIIFWDIGANIGLYSVYASLKHKNKIRTISFEPSNNNLRILSRNISLNNLQKKIYINSLALGRKKTNYQQFADDQFIEGSAFNQLRNDIKKRKNNAYTLLSSSIDKMSEINKNLFPNYIKIDVDGNELDILTGGKKTFKKKFVHSVLIEIDEKSKDYKKILNFFKKNNFQLKSINKSKYFISQNKCVKNYIFDKVLKK